jgi:hypothetical protein
MDTDHAGLTQSANHGASSFYIVLDNQYLQGRSPRLILARPCKEPGQTETIFRS